MDAKADSTSEESMRLLNDPTVTLRCGDASFMVHRNLVCQASPFFKSAFTGDGEYVETSTQSMDLSGTEVTVDAVNRFVEWLYTRCYALSSTSTPQETQERYMELARLFIFAEEYIVVDLKNDIVDKLFDIKAKCVDPPRLPLVRYVYENTPMGSPFRQLLVAYYSWHIDMEWYGREAISTQLYKNPEFTTDLAVSLGKRLDGKHKSLFDGKPSDLYAVKNTESGQKEAEK
ncbi:hypothetical protein G7Y79_00017g043520 [Physcia stellaris]|nr:hypothetical protein G7Y79_00017g043520 [Physcia stellaris]